MIIIIIITIATSGSDPSAEWFYLSQDIKQPRHSSIILPAPYYLNLDLDFDLDVRKCLSSTLTRLTKDRLDQDGQV